MRLRALKSSLIAFLVAITVTSCQSEQETPKAQPEHETMKVKPEAETKPESMSNMEGMPSGYAEVKIDPQRIQLFGVRTEKIISRELSKSVRAVGIVAADERLVKNIQTKFSGWIVDLYVNFTNQSVKKGEPLFSVYSPALLATQEEYLIAKKGTKNQLKGTFGEEYSRTNQKLLESVKQRLELWDIPQEEIERLDRQGTPMRTLTIRSPIDGIVLQKNAFAGMNVEPGMNTFIVANLSHIWVLADIFEQDIASILIGQQATFIMNAFPGRVFEGQVDFINYVLDQTTRTTKVRLEFHNPEILMKPGMYGVVELTIPIGFVLALPEAAVIDTGTQKIVFIEKGPGLYMPVEVQLGAKGGEFYQVLKGLNENDLVVTSSQFLMDSESRIKATGGGMQGMEMEKK
uniref:Conserved putative secreted protein n=1 Tax=Candidatus Criblamydia sequanensis CRIB-18 TaxID=1437425 RepID=A0A090D131_9BACT|nr:efflux RND transporter periplasmic adaptor subunit [Criblamydia sequanensis]CDR35273.1 Conserved putative secreted protein [Criblamydia sequanensis CRIB-18]